MLRLWVSATGKVGGNYAAGLRGEAFGHDQGYSVVLYLDPREKKNIDEFSTSNFIGIKGNTYITPSSPSILKSITNKSLAQIAEDLGMKVERRDIAIDEVESFDEVGAVGTAASNLLLFTKLITVEKIWFSVMNRLRALSSPSCTIVSHRFRPASIRIHTAGCMRLR